MTNSYSFTILTHSDGVFTVCDPLGRFVFVPACCPEHCFEFLKAATARFNAMSSKERRNFGGDVMDFIELVLGNESLMTALLELPDDVPEPSSVSVEYVDRGTTPPGKGGGSVH